MRLAEFERLAATATTVHVPTPGGAVVAAQLFGPPAMPPVVLLHGGVGSWNHWAATIPDLSRRFRVVALDLPGCGDSTLPAGMPAGTTVDVGGVDLLAGAVAHAVEHLVAPPQRLGLGGFSFGGIVAGRAACLLGPRVALLALIGAGGLGVRSVEDPPLRVVPRDAPSEDREAAHRHNLAAVMLADHRSVDDLAVHLHEANVRRSRFRMGEVPTSTALIDVLDGIAAPLLWITGDRDVYAAGVQEQRRALIAAARPDAEVVGVPDAGHWAAYERPDVVNPLLADRFSRALGCR